MYLELFLNLKDIWLTKAWYLTLGDMKAILSVDM